MTTRLAKHPRLKELAALAEQKFHEDLYHSITLPDGDTHPLGPDVFAVAAGYPFGEIPDWLIRQRSKVPDWAPDWVRQHRKHDMP